MSREIMWNQIILDEFIRIGGLTDEEEQIMRTRVKGWSTEKQALEFHMSISKVNSLIKRCKQKYDNCQMYSPILPKRKKGGGIIND